MFTRAELALRKLAALAGAFALLAPSLAQSAPQDAAQSTSAQRNVPEYKFRVNSDLVLVSVTARDKRGNLVCDLQQSDFTVQEDGKTQKLLSFDVEDVKTINAAGPAQTETTSAPAIANVLNGARVAHESVRDRRLIVLFFDLSSMQPEDIDRALGSARKFVDQQMSPADLVSVVSFNTSLTVLNDFTSDRKQLSAVLARMQNSDGQGFDNGTTGSLDAQPETGASFAADETDYNIFNTDRKLQAIQSLAQTLSAIDQRKSILYFTGGMERTGTENQTQLRAAINAAVRANVALYPVDSRGLEAFAPGGSAQNASLRGTAAYSGAAVQSQFDSNFASQETLVTMASDTGGKAFLDSNDFTKAYDKVQADTESYYVLGYRSTNTGTDGRFRRITVKVNRSDLKLEYRKGYYGPRDFQHFTKDDREQQLEDELASDMPSTGLPVYLSAEIFRSTEDRYFVPVSLVVPGSAIPFTQSSDKDKASLDIIALVRESQTKLPVGNVRETVKLNVDGSQQVRQKNVQYNTSFLLPPGSYHLKFVVRENQNGKIGSFETDVKVPDMRKQPLRMSTVVMASQRVPNTQKKSTNPLINNGEELIPNIAHVFTTQQPMLFYYEVYEPAKNKSAGKSANDAIHVLTSIQFFRGKIKTYETAPVEATELNIPNRKAAAFQFEVPASQLKPGWYTCQVNVIDDAGGTFAFPRLPLLIRESTPAVAQR